MRSPKITVGMPVFNRAKVLENTIQQVLDQTFSDFELIIFNDGSTDNTIEILNKIDDPRVEIINSVNVGPPHPLNAILKKASGEFIIILHDHDFFAPTLLQKSVEALENNPNAGFVLQGSAWIDEDGVSNYKEMLHDLPEYNKGADHGISMLRSNNFNSIFHACCMVRKSVHQKAGLFYDPQFGLYADVDLWYRLLAITDFVYIKEVLFKFRTREAQGHFLNNKQFEIIDWKYQIAFKNAALLGNKKELDEINSLLLGKRLKIIKLLAIKYATQKNKSMFIKGLEILKMKSMSFLEKNAIYVLLNVPILLTTTMNTLYLLNKYKKKIYHHN